MQYEGLIWMLEFWEPGFDYEKYENKIFKDPTKILLQGKTMDIILKNDDIKPAVAAASDAKPKPDPKNKKKK